MARETGGGLGLAAAVLLLAWPRIAVGQVRDDALRVLLPADQAAPGWSRDGVSQEFAGEDLYAYIDGGAEIYEEYGFRRVIIEDYKSAAGKSVSLEIFEMDGPSAAFGMFTFKRSGHGKAVALGSGGELDDYYLNFWKGCFVVTLTGFDAEAATLAGLQAVAAAVDAKIANSAKAPGLVEALPREGLIPGSVKYIKGRLGLNNLYPFYTARGLGFKDGVRALYESGETLIILDYGTAEARRSAWLALRAELEKSDRFDRPRNYLADAVVFQDKKGDYIAFGEAGARLAIGIHDTLDWALDTVARIR